MRAAAPVRPPHPRRVRGGWGGGKGGGTRARPRSYGVWGTAGGGGWCRVPASAPVGLAGGGGGAGRGAILCSNRTNRPSVGPFRTALRPPLWRADVPTETPPSCTPAAGVHPLGGDAACTAVHDRRALSLGSRRQPSARRGNGIRLGRCLLRIQVFLTRTTPCPRHRPVGWPMEGLLMAVADMGAAGAEKREELPALLRAAAAAASERASGGRALRTGGRSPLRDGGRGRGAGGSRARGTAGQRLEGGADGSRGPVAWRSAKGQGGGRVQAGAAHGECGKRGSCARHLWRGPWRPVFIRPARAARPSAAPSTGHRGGRCRPLRAAAGLGGRRGDTAVPAARRRGPRTRRRSVAAARWSAGVRWGSGRATPVPTDPATARGRWRGCRLNNNSIHIRRGARRCARGARGAEAHASKLSLVVVVHTTERHQLLVEGEGKGGRTRG